MENSYSGGWISGTCEYRAISVLFRSPGKVQISEKGFPMTRSPHLTLEEAMRKAKGYVAHTDSLCELLEKADRKAEKNYEFLIPVWESLRSLIRLIRAWLLGRYTASPVVILMATAAIVYFVYPLDFIPDGIPVLGFVDDSSVITFVAKANIQHLSRFRS